MDLHSLVLRKCASICYELQASVSYLLHCFFLILATPHTFFLIVSFLVFFQLLYYLLLILSLYTFLELGGSVHAL